MMDKNSPPPSDLRKITPHHGPHRNLITADTLNGIELRIAEYDARKDRFDRHHDPRNGDWDITPSKKLLDTDFELEVPELTAVEPRMLPNVPHSMDVKNAGKPKCGQTSKPRQCRT